MMSEVFSEMMRESNAMQESTVIGIDSKHFDKVNEKMIPLEEEARLKYRDLATQLDRRYQQERKHQDEIGINFSRITPTASFIFLATDTTQTGQTKKKYLHPNGNSLL